MSEFLLEDHKVLSVTEIRAGIQRYADMEYQWAISQKQKGAVTGMLAKAIKSFGFEGEEVDFCRHLILGYLTLPHHLPLTPISSKTLTDGQWVGLGRWQSYRTIDGAYYERKTYLAECTVVLHHARHDHMVGNGQLPLFGMLMYWESQGVSQDYWNFDSFRDYVAMKTNNGDKKQRLLNLMEMESEL